MAHSRGGQQTLKFAQRSAPPRAAPRTPRSTHGCNALPPFTPQNEAGNVGAALKSVFENRTPGARPPLEAIVVDGGSRDATRSEARRAGARVVAAPRGRGAQLNAGWRRAKGDWVLFLHADSRLPQGYDALIRQALQQRRAEAQAQTQAQQLSQQCPSRPAEGRRQRGAAGSDGCCCQRGGSAGGRGAVEAACAPPAWGCFSSIDVPEVSRAWGGGSAESIVLCVLSRTATLLTLHHA